VPDPRLRRFHHSSFPPELIARHRTQSVTICIPTRNEAATIGETVTVVTELQRVGVVDQVIVADDSTDATGEIAAEAGAEVVHQADLLPDYGPVLGKGDAMWRALSVARGEIVCFVDGDSQDFGSRLPCGLIGAVALAGVGFAKGTFRRPYRTTVKTEPRGGGRVTELTAKPLLSLLFPELLVFEQPLSGEIAAQRAILAELPFSSFYAVDITLLIDVWRRVGLEEMAEVDLDVRQNRHRDLQELSMMARQVAGAILSRHSGMLCSDSVGTPVTRPIERPALVECLASEHLASTRRLPSATQNPLLTPGT
jgi:glucosyl-3-phosphoglycerate synthase